MLISVVIPVFNRGEVVKSTLASVVAQTHRPLQVVLIDNNSTDYTLATLQQFKHDHEAPDFIIDVVQESRPHAGAARNRGVKEVRGEWLLFFDSDDLMEPSLIAEYARVVEAHAGALDMVMTRCRLHRQNGTTREHPFFCSDLIANHILHSIAATQHYCIRREFYDRSGGWNPTLPAWNDWELGLRLLLLKPRVAFLNQTLVKCIEMGEASITGTSFSKRAGNWERVFPIMEQNIRNAGHGQEKRFLHLVSYRKVVLAAHYAREGRSDLARGLYAEGYKELARHNVLLRLAVPVLYWHIRAGHRGAARIARLIIS